MWIFQATYLISLYTGQELGSHYLSSVTVNYIQPIFHFVVRTVNVVNSAFDCLLYKESYNKMHFNKSDNFSVLIIY
jgi:hypothetical protein